MTDIATITAGSIAISKCEAAALLRRAAMVAICLVMLCDVASSHDEFSLGRPVGHIQHSVMISKSGGGKSEKASQYGQPKGVISYSFFRSRGGLFAGLAFGSLIGALIGLWIVCWVSKIIKRSDDAIERYRKQKP